MHAHKNWLRSVNVALHKCNVLNAINSAAVCNTTEGAIFGGNGCFTHALNKSFVVATVVNELFDGRQQQTVLFAELTKVRQPHHGAVIVLNFADNTHWFTPSQTRKVNSGFRVASTL